MSMTASMMTREEFLEHYGVKGQKWGVLRGQAASGNQRAKKALERADRDWDKELHSVDGWIKVNNAVADKANGPNGYIAKLNSNPAYKDVKNFQDHSDPKVKAYWEEANAVIKKNWDETLVELYGESPSGRFKIEPVKAEDSNYYMEVVDTQALSHASTFEKLRIYFLVSPIGRPLGVKLLDEGGTLMHAEQMMTIDEFLEHAGVKGMKWGQRRAINKEAKAAANADRDREISNARVRFEKTGRTNYLKAKSDLKIVKSQKKVMTPTEYANAKAKAKAALTKVKEKNMADYELGSKNKSGAETVVSGAATAAVILAGLAGIAISAYSNS